MKILHQKPLLLYSYLATEMLAPFFASFIIMNGVFFLVKLIPFLNFALDLSLGTGDFIRLFSYMFPNIFLYTLPMASMMGIIIGFSRLSNDTEILALKASGISMYQILPPVLIIAAFIALFTSYFSVKIIPASESAMKQLTYQLLKEKIDKGIKEYQFTEALGDLVIHVGEIDQQTGQWQNVWVSDMRGQTNPTITMASSGSMRSDLNKMDVTIVLENGSLHRPDDKDAQIVSFEKYIITIPISPPAQKNSGVHRSTLSMPRLLEVAQEYGLDNKRGRVMLIEFHERLVLPVGCFILTLLGLPLGLQGGPGKKAIGIPIGLAVFILYYVLFTMTKILSKEGVASIAMLMWIPNTVFFAMTLYAIHRVTNERPLLSESISYAISRLYQATLQPLFTLIARLISAARSFVPAARKPDSNATHMKQRQPDTTMLHGDVKRMLYHFPDCRYYEGSDCTMELKDIEFAENSGFSSCRECTRTK